MDTTDTPLAENIAPGTIPMARIDGAAIRRLRESKGLTQLYMATVIGVTTDTVSRWENRRYPSIKLENADKLAEALEVDLNAILEQEAIEAPPAVPPLGTLAADEQSAAPVPPSPQATIPLTPATARPRPPMTWLLTIALLFSLAGLALWKTLPTPAAISIVAERILPDHIPSGQSFPVLIRVTSSQAAPLALIIKESLPPDCKAISTEPPLASGLAAGGTLKWISRTDTQETTFAYLLQAPAKAGPDSQLRFSGEITLNQGDQTKTMIGGKTTMTIAPYHWADLDQNNTIDDEEILAVYDRYSAIPQLNFDRDRIDELWAASSYRWERQTGKYVAQQETTKQEDSVP